MGDWKRWVLSYEAPVLHSRLYLNSCQRAGSRLVFTFVLKVNPSNNSEKLRFNELLFHSLMQEKPCSLPPLRFSFTARNKSSSVQRFSEQLKIKGNTRRKSSEQLGSFTST